MLVLFVIYGLIVARFELGIFFMIGHKLDDLHMTVLYICCGLSLMVFLGLMYALIKLHQFKTVNFHKSLATELFWATLPFLILVVLALPTFM